MDLTTVPGNFLTDATSIEAFAFSEGSGAFRGLFVPARTLTPAGVGSTPIVRGARGPGGNRTIRFPAGCNQYLIATAADAWCMLSASEGYLAICGWVRRPVAAASNGMLIGIDEVSMEQQYAIDMQGGGTGAVSVQMFMDTEDPLAAADTGTIIADWQFITVQMYRNPAGTSGQTRIYQGASLLASATEAGALNIPGIAVSLMVGFGQAMQSTNVELSSLIFWKSSSAWLDTTSMAALENGGSGIELVGGGKRRRMMRRLLALGGL